MPKIVKAETFNAILDIFDRNEVDWKAICLEVAKQDPELFVGCAVGNVKAWENEACRIFETEGKVAAIKYIRAQTGLGLKEAKEYSERLQEQRGLRSATF